jgi:hypothetical protein
MRPIITNKGYKRCPNCDIFMARVTNLRKGKVTSIYWMCPLCKEIKEDGV